MRKHTFTVLAAIAAALVITGCSSSDEAMKPAPPPEPSATEALQKELADCRSENLGLKQQTARLEQENKAAATRAADLESQLAALKASVPPPRPKPVVRDARAGYESAITLFRSRNYADAASTLQSILESGAPADLEDNCNYWLGECAYAMKDYGGALEFFTKVFTFASSEKKDDAQMMIANVYLAQGDRPRAKAEYQKLLDRFPASPYAKRAREKMAGL
jgi:TolA-binding protein